jgi:8-oxo-dGTP pyrophosphatase MutT (NUDIX family)
VLLMVRAERPGDRWSGQVSLPGGHAELVDEDLRATARRETLEEVGVVLTERDSVGQLPSVQARARGRRLPMLITPFTFALRERPQLALGPEAADAFWLPLERAREGEFDTEHRYREGELVHRLPGWRFGDRTIWGLTHGMLQQLLRATVSST